MRELLPGRYFFLSSHHFLKFIGWFIAQESNMFIYIYIPMFTWNQYCSLIIWKLIFALINWFLHKRSHYDSIVHKLLNHILWFRKKKSSKDIVADHQYFSWMHISSLLLQVIGSYGNSDSLVCTNTVLHETQLGIPLSSSQAHRIWMSL